MKQSLKIIIGIICVAVILYLVWHMLFEASINNRLSKEAVAKMHNEIALADSVERVTSIYEKTKTFRNTIRTDVFKNTWVIGMPFEFGASDWILYIQYDMQNKVSSVAMRTSDGMHSKPANSPKDKGNFVIPKAAKE